MLKSERGIVVGEFDEEMKGNRRERIGRKRRRGGEEEAMVFGNCAFEDNCQSK